MRLKELIRAPKTIQDAGAWKVGVKMPKTAFPVAKNRGFAIRGKYRWRIVKFTSLGHKYRLLIAYRADIQQYLAYLGQMTDGDMRVVCLYEFHGSHPGWHVHTICDELETLDTGRTKQPRMRRLRRKDESFDLDDSKALYTAYKVFGLLHDDGGLLA